MSSYSPYDMRKVVVSYRTQGQFSSYYRSSRIFFNLHLISKIPGIISSPLNKHIFYCLLISLSIKGNRYEVTTHRFSIDFSKVWKHHSKSTPINFCYAEFSLDSSQIRNGKRLIRSFSSIYQEISTYFFKCVQMFKTWRM